MRAIILGSGAGGGVPQMPTQISATTGIDHFMAFSPGSSRERWPTAAVGIPGQVELRVRRDRSLQLSGSGPPARTIRSSARGLADGAGAATTGIDHFMAFSPGSSRERWPTAAVGIPGQVAPSAPVVAEICVGMEVTSYESAEIDPFN
jgi:coenzyme PQQ precursor peptide PqqA